MSKELLIISAVWCPSCLIMNKYIKKIQQEYPTLEIIKLDYDLDEEKVEPYQVGSILPVMILKNDRDEEIGRLVGEKDYYEVIEFIQENY